MPETTSDPADVHTGTDRVELTDAEKWLIPHLTQLDAAADARDVYAAVESIIAARIEGYSYWSMVQKNEALRAELAAANARCAELEAEYKSLEVGYNAQVQHSRNHYVRAEALQATLDRVTALPDEWEAAEVGVPSPDTALSGNECAADLRAALTPEGTE